MITRRSRGRTALPVLVALLFGATTAGTATMLSEPIGAAAGGAEALATSFTQVNRPPAPAKRTATRTTTATPTTTTAAPAKPTTSPPQTTTSAPKPTAPQPTSSAPAPPSAQLDQVVALVNEARADAGCAALKVDQRLNTAAAAHSADMSARDYFAHTTPEGVAFDERIKQAGYPMPGAENLAKGQQSADEVMEGWMKSKGHKANILNCQLTTIGMGLATEGMYWTQDFGY